MDHAVEIAHLLVGVGEDRVIDRGVLGVVDVGDPATVALGAIDGEGDGLDVALLPFGPQARNLTELGGANRGVICGVGE